MKTSGHIWKLGRVIDTAYFPKKLPWIDEGKGNLTLYERKRLLQLANFLKKDGYHFLAGKIDNYLAYDAASVGKKWMTFTQMHLHCMAVELAAAILAGRKLRLGAVWYVQRQSPYRAVFVLPQQQCNEPPRHAFVFTSVRQGRIGSYQHCANDIDYNVSLTVQIEGWRQTATPCAGLATWHVLFPRLSVYHDGFPLAKIASRS